MVLPPRPASPNPFPERSSTLIEDAANLPGRSPPGHLAVDRSVTVIEAEEDVRQGLAGLRNPPQGAAAASGIASVSAARSQPANLFRPTVRPPVPLLTVYDDGKPDG